MGEVILKQVALSHLLTRLLLTLLAGWLAVEIREGELSILLSDLVQLDARQMGNLHAKFLVATLSSST